MTQLTRPLYQLTTGSVICVESRYTTQTRNIVEGPRPRKSWPGEICQISTLSVLIMSSRGAQKSLISVCAQTREGLANAADFMSAVNSAELAAEFGVPTSRLEGYLYPDTYQLPRGLPAGQIVRLMLKQFDRVWSKEIEEFASTSKLSRNEIVILASIVEKETASPSERPLIASVFLNRLARRMRLETDPTVIYGIPDFDGNLRKKDLKNDKNPYNTYRIPGLPPGPIANPGLDALRAVVKPDESEYLYFVSRNDGTHHFSVSYREHTNAVNRYQKRRQR